MDFNDDERLNENIENEEENEEINQETSENDIEIESEELSDISYDSSAENEYFKHQEYTPNAHPKYGNTYYTDEKFSGKNTKKSGNSTAIIITLSVVCAICIIAIAAVIGIVAVKGTDFFSFGSKTVVDNNGEDNNKQFEKEAEQNKEEDEKGEYAVDDYSIAIGDTNGKSKISYNEIYEKCSPAAVGILCTAQTTSYFYGTTTAQYVGSGFIIDERGYIATNAHVVSDMDTITVYLEDGTQKEAALVGCDKLSDIAVIKIESDESLPVMEFGDSSNLKVGDIVAAIGTPADISLAGTFTQGIISAVDREVSTTDNGVTKKMKLLQTDATINPGNSGGPLLNQYGQVIGINTMKLTDEFEGIGFAIPSLYAKEICEKIISTGKSISLDPDNGYVSVDETPQLGIANCQDITEQMSRKYRIPQGVMIMLLESNSAVGQGGAQVGDIITEFNGVTITTLDELKAERDKVKPRENATMKVYRSSTNQYITITFTMGSNINYQ